MKKVVYWRVLSFVFLILGIYFSFGSQNMLHWTTGMSWFWVAICLSYLFLVLSILFLFLKGKIGVFGNIVGVVIILACLYWTTFIMSATIYGF